MDMTQSHAGAATVQSLQRGLQILDIVVQAREPLRLAEIARQLDMDRTSVFRLLQTLEREGFVTKDPRSKRYTVGGHLLQWASTVGHDASLLATARPYLETLVARTDESGHVGVISKEQALLLDYIGSNGTIVVQNRVGVFEPLHCTALGKVLLAFQPHHVRESLLERLPLDRYTPTTIVDREALRNVIDEVRRSSVAYDRGEYTGVLCCVAAPIIGRDGHAIGAIGVSMVKPLAERTPDHVEHVAMEVRGVAREMTIALGGIDVADSIFGSAGSGQRPADA